MTKRAKPWLTFWRIWKEKGDAANMAKRIAKSELSKLKNIGETIERQLNEIGVFSREDLKKVGPVSAFRKIKQNYPDMTISVCYYLYSLQGALNDMHWDASPASAKA
jgi:DNA transformation protein and related proteins